MYLRLEPTMSSDLLRWLGPRFILAISTCTSANQCLLVASLTSSSNSDSPFSAIHFCDAHASYSLTMRIFTGSHFIISRIHRLDPVTKSMNGSTSNKCYFYITNFDVNTPLWHYVVKKGASQKMFHQASYQPQVFYASFLLCFTIWWNYFSSYRNTWRLCTCKLCLVESTIPHESSSTYFLS